MSKGLCILSLIAFMLAFSSCRHKDFCYFHPHGEIFVLVDYDDDNDSDDAAHLRDNVRATRLHAYERQSGELTLVTDIDLNVNRLPLYTDTYHFIACNAGTQRISFRDREQFSFHSATTRTCDIIEPLYSSRAVGSNIDLGNGQDVVIAADPLWAVGAEAVKCNIDDTVKMTAVPLHCRYTYEMRNVEGLSGVSRMSSFITGMARGVDMGCNELHDTPVTVAVPAAVGADGKSITGSFMCFGQNPRIDTRHRMGLFLEMESGRKISLLEGDHFDVTEQVVSAANRRRVHIVIDGVKIPTDDSGGGGFEVTVSPWTPGEDMDIDYYF